VICAIGDAPNRRLRGLAATAWLTDLFSSLRPVRDPCGRVVRRTVPVDP